MAAAWGARAIACIGPVDEISGPGASIVPDYFNFSKLLFYFCPNPGLRAVPAPGDALYDTATMDALGTKSTAPWVVDAPRRYSTAPWAALEAYVDAQRSRPPRAQTHRAMPLDSWERIEVVLMEARVEVCVNVCVNMCAERGTCLTRECESLELRFFTASSSLMDRILASC